MWIGTTEGLNRYDGFGFVIYTNNIDDSASLPDNRIRAIFEDHNNNLIIGTQTGLCLYNREKDNFLNYMTDKSSPLRGMSCTVGKLDEDSLGNLWMATNVGLIYFDRIKNQIINYTHDPNNSESLCFNYIESVLIDRRNRLWVSTRKGLDLFLSRSGTFKHIINTADNKGDLSGTFFLNMIEDKEGDLWFGSTEGLYRLKNKPDGSLSGLIHYQHDDNDKNSLTINQIKSLYVDDEGNLWAGSENAGLNLFDPRTQKFWHYRKDDYNPMSLNNESIQVITQDKTGNLWIGTFAGGLNIAVKNRDAIFHYQALPGAPLSLSNNLVKCFLEDQQGQLWIGTDGGGLNLFDKEQNRFQWFTTDNSDLSSNAILCMAEVSANQIWMGTWAGGLVLFDSEKYTFKSFTTKNSGITDDNIYAIVPGDNDDLWLGTFNHGLVHFQIKDNRFTSFLPGTSGLVNEMVDKIIKNPDGRLLLGSPNCFQIFSPATNRWVTYLPDPGDTNSLSNQTITTILAENDSCIWIGTRFGLNRFNPYRGSFKRYFETDGLSNNIIKGLILDDSGNLWVTTNKGLSLFDRRNGEFKRFTKADGLQSNEFTEGSILKTQNGALLMGGVRGFNVIYPGKITKNNFVPDVLITDLKIFNRSVIPGAKNSPLINNIMETKILTLSHKMSILTFYFAVMDFSIPEKNEYAYWMEGFDDSWVYSGNKREATYTNLNPGKYVFHVKGSNNDGVWNNEGISMQVIVLPPWYARWWIRVVAVLVLIFIFVSIFVSRVRHLKNQKILLEKLVADKTSELYELNASKDKFFSIIAHDLKNPFNNIIGFSELLQEEIRSGDNERNMEYADSINNSAVQTLSLLENLLEWAKSQTGKTLYKPQPVLLSELINEEYLMLRDQARGKKIEFKREVPDDLKIIADRNMIKTVLRNLISNAIKFTNKNGKIDVKAMADHQTVDISVTDNGMGMSEDAISKLFKIDSNMSTPGTENEKGTGLGLLLCKEFVEKHGGRLYVKSEISKGTVFTFSLPYDNSIH
jgi:signal transduction histidine kinase/ligand-binding sensor domain-containing protein